MFSKKIKPVFVSNKNLIRIGPKRDGGYVIDKRIIKTVDHIITCGLSDDWNFEKDFLKIIIDFPRAKLIKKIHNRTTQMLDRGAIREVKNFSNLKIPKDKSISKAIGIYEIDQYLKKNIDKKKVIEKISIKTRQYAKRQMTWARGHMVNWKKIRNNRLSNFLKNI